MKPFHWVAIATVLLIAVFAGFCNGVALYFYDLIAAALFCLEFFISNYNERMFVVSIDEAQFCVKLLRFNMTLSTRCYDLEELVGFEADTRGFPFNDTRIVAKFADGSAIALREGYLDQSFTKEIGRMNRLLSNAKELIRKRSCGEL